MKEVDIGEEEEEEEEEEKEMLKRAVPIPWKEESVTRRGMGERVLFGVLVVGFCLVLGVFLEGVEEDDEEAEVDEEDEDDEDDEEDEEEEEEEEEEERMKEREM